MQQMIDYAQRASQDAAFDPATLTLLWSEVIFHKLREYPDLSGGHQGGFFLLSDNEYDLLWKEHGLQSDQRRKDTGFFAREKVTRLIRNGDDASMQTRDVNKRHWGGGVFLGDTICGQRWSSFPGFKEAGDAIVAIGAPRLASMIGFDRSLRLAAKSSCLEPYKMIMTQLTGMSM